jgi:phosphoribosylglycinamide formyltransferase 1
MVKKNSCVFISGKGTNLKALIDSTRNYNFPVNIKMVVSNKKDAPGLKYAKKYSIPFFILKTKDTFFETKILNEIKKQGVTLICLAGYMKILSKSFINNFKGKIINLHPSLLPKYKGVNTFQRVLKNKEKLTGCTVHYVNERLDSGRIINRKIMNISNDDTIHTLKKRTQKLEYRAFSEAVIKINI